MNALNYFIGLSRVFWAYRTGKTRLGYLPLRLWVEPTNACNLRCGMCLNREFGGDEVGYMEFGVFEKIISEARGFAHDVNLFHRGEPLLHPRIFDMIEYAKKNGLKTRLYTNGTLLTEDRSKKLLDSGIDFVAFSFDGCDKKEYERMRVGADYDKTLENIRNFLKAKERLGKKTFTMIESIEAEPNNKPEKLIEEFKGLPLDKLVSRRPHNWGGNLGDAGVDKKAGYVLCTFPWYSLTILWDGSVVLCPQDWFGKTNAGNIKDSTIKDLWNDKKIVGYRKAFLEKSIPRSCTDCDRLFRENLFGVPIKHLRALFLGNI